MKKVFHVVVCSIVAALLLSSLAVAKSDTAPLDKTSPEIRGVVAAVVSGVVVDDPAIKFGKFKSDQTNLLGGKFDTKGFKLANTALLKVKKEADGSSLMTGALLFADDSKRTFMVGFRSAYTMDGETAVVSKTSVGLLAPEEPLVKLFWVPEDVVKAAGTDIYASWQSLYKFASTNDKTAKMSKKGIMYGFVFCMEQIAPDAKFDVVVSLRKREKSTKKSIAKSNSSNYYGWRVGIVTGEIKLGSLRTKFYLNAVYTPGTPTPEDDRDKEIILNFASNKL